MFDKCKAEKAAYDAACTQWEAANAARIAAEQQYFANPTPNNLVLLQLAFQYEAEALAAKNAAFTIWQMCENPMMNDLPSP